VRYLNDVVITKNPPTGLNFTQSQAILLRPISLHAIVHCTSCIASVVPRSPAWQSILRSRYGVTPLHVSHTGDAISAAGKHASPVGGGCN